MITRDLSDGRALVILQEDHADVAAQFAAHWGSSQFSRLDPYRSLVFGTIYHDSGHREMEADLPGDVEKGLPFALGRTPAGLRKREADVASAQWIETRDPYASLITSVHHAGLRKRRYDTLRRRDQASRGGDGEPLGRESAFGDLEDWQKHLVDQLSLTEEKAREAFWHNYQCLQMYDILSLYLCWDGYDGDQLKPVVVEKVPVSYGSDQHVDVELTPKSQSVIRVAPYPFDVDPLPISVMTRHMKPVLEGGEPAVKEAFYKSKRHPLTWEFTS